MAMDKPELRNFDIEELMIIIHPLDLLWGITIIECR